MKSSRLARAKLLYDGARSGLLGALAWALFFAALAVVPDEKPLRLKLAALDVCVLLAGLAAAWASARSERSFARTPADLPVALWACVATLFWLGSREPADSAPELARALSCAVVFFAASQGWARLERPAAALSAWAVSGAATGLWAWRQWRFEHVERPLGGFGNPIFLGQFLAAAAAATFCLAALERDRRARLLLAVALFIEVLGIWFSQSRAAFAGLGAALSLWLILRVPARRRWPIAAGLLVAAAYLFLHFRERSMTHWLIWRGAIDLWLAHPWFGCGLGRFHLEFPDYAPLGLKALWPKSRVVVNYAHNEYLQLLAETGVAGCLAFLAAPLALAWKLAPLPAERDERARLADVPALAAAALLAGAAASPDLRFGVSSLVCFAALGMAAGLRLSEWSSWRSVPAWTRAPALAAATLILATWGRLAVGPLLAERRLQAQPDFRDDHTKRRAENEPDPEARGYYYAQQSNWPEAIKSFQRAAALDPGRPGPLNNLGNVYYSLGDQAAAESYWQRSLVVSPSQADANINLAKLLYERGDLKEAARHAQAALKADPGNPKALALLKRMTGG